MVNYLINNTSICCHFLENCFCNGGSANVPCSKPQDPWCKLNAMLLKIKLKKLIMNSYLSLYYHLHCKATNTMAWSVSNINPESCFVFCFCFFFYSVIISGNWLNGKHNMSFFYILSSDYKIIVYFLCPVSACWDDICTSCSCA